MLSSPEDRERGTCVRITISDMPPSANAMRSHFIAGNPVSDALVAAGVVADDSLAEEVRAKWADNLGGPAVVVLICAAEREMAA